MCIHICVYSRIPLYPLRLTHSHKISLYSPPPLYGATSLIRNRLPQAPYSRTMHRDL